MQFRPLSFNEFRHMHFDERFYGRDFNVDVIRDLIRYVPVQRIHTPKTLLEISVINIARSVYRSKKSSLRPYVIDKESDAIAHRYTICSTSFAQTKDRIEKIWNSSIQSLPVPHYMKEKLQNVFYDAMIAEGEVVDHRIEYLLIRNRYFLRKPFDDAMLITLRIIFVMFLYKILSYL